MIELWRPVAGVDGYEVSDLGRVRSVDRIDAAGRKRSGKVLSTFDGPSGYAYVTMYRNGARVMRSVAKLVADAFVPGRDGAHMVRHANGDGKDNRASNLVWRKRGQR